MGKRLRRARSICCCASPRLSVHVSRQSNVNWYDVDIWTEIAKFMDGRSLVMLAVTCKWFNRTMMEDSIWKFACLRDLQVPDPGNVNFKWIKLYTTAFDGSHSYMFCQQEKHIEPGRADKNSRRSDDTKNVADDWLLRIKLNKNWRLLTCGLYDAPSATLMHVMEQCKSWIQDILSCSIKFSTMSCMWSDNSRVISADGSHSYMFCQQEKHIDWMRIGAFSLDSHAALLTESLEGQIRIPEEVTTQKMSQMTGCCVLNSIKTGIWIADLRLVRCSICDLDACDGTMQVLDTRHIELFLNEGYLEGSWDYELVGSHDINKQADAASGGIFDIEHIKDQSTSDILNSKLWVGKRTDWQPKYMVTLHAVAVNTNLQQNDGLQIKFQAMKAGKNGEIVSIRISQQLL